MLKYGLHSLKLQYVSCSTYSLSLCTENRAWLSASTSFSLVYLFIVFFPLNFAPRARKRPGNENDGFSLSRRTHCKDFYNTIPVRWHTLYMEYQVCRAAVQPRYHCRNKCNKLIKCVSQSFSLFVYRKIFHHWLVYLAWNYFRALHIYRTRWPPMYLLCSKHITFEQYISSSRHFFRQAFTTRGGPCTREKEMLVGICKGEPTCAWKILYLLL